MVNFNIINRKRAEFVLAVCFEAAPSYFCLRSFRVFNMSDLLQRITRIELLSQNLLKAHLELQEQNKTLNQKIRGMESELYQKNSELAQLERELKTARIAQGISKNSEGADLAKAQISSLVREIDRCIALLNE